MQVSGRQWHGRGAAGWYLRVQVAFTQDGTVPRRPVSSIDSDDVKGNSCRARFAARQFLALPVQNLTESSQAPFEMGTAAYSPFYQRDTEAQRD